MLEPKDRVSLSFAHMRLMIGLSAGAVILVATFLRDLLSEPTLRPLLIIALVSFAFCIALSMLWIGALLEAATQEKDTTFLRITGSDWVYFSAQLTFFVGLICLSVFVIYNLYAERAVPTAAHHP